MWVGYSPENAVGRKPHLKGRGLEPRFTWDRVLKQCVQCRCVCAHAYVHVLLLTYVARKLKNGASPGDHHIL